VLSYAVCIGLCILVLQLSSLPSNSNQASSLPSNVPAQSPGMLDKLFKSKKTSTSSKSRPDDKSGSKAAVVTKKEKISSKTSKKEESKISKPPLSSSIPRGGSISSRSRTPSRENLAKCRIQAPSAVGKATNRLSSDSGIHSPAEGKPESRESALVRNNSLPSSRVLSTKDSALSRQTALRASTNSPVTSKKERTLPKALSYSSKPASSSVDKQRPEGNSENSSSNVRLKIPPPLPSSLPPSSLPASSIQPPATSNLPSSSGKPPPAYQHTSGISQPLRPHSASSKISTSVSNSPYQSKDDINQAKKLQQQAMQAGHRAKTESNTQTDTSALQRIARKTEVRYLLSLPVLTLSLPILTLSTCTYSLSTCTYSPYLYLLSLYLYLLSLYLYLLSLHVLTLSLPVLTLSLPVLTLSLYLYLLSLPVLTLSLPVLTLSTCTYSLSTCTYSLYLYLLSLYM